jgi:zinc transport system permease protein
MIDLLPYVSGCFIAVNCGLLGTFVVAQRLSFFTEALSHASLLGISVSLLLHSPMNISFCIAGLFFAVVFSYFLSRTQLTNDTLIGILSPTFLAISLLMISLFSDTSIDLEHYLFGEITKIIPIDFTFIIGCLGLSAWFIYSNWEHLLLTTIDSDLAYIEGVNISRIQLQLTLVLALLITTSIQLIGALLITSLLIIPASAAHLTSRSPKKSIILSTVYGLISVIIGLTLSNLIDGPTGPTIVFTASLLFLFKFIVVKRSLIRQH